MKTKSSPLCKGFISDRFYAASLTMLLSIIEVTLFNLYSSVSAQITPDNTLGEENSVVTPDEINGVESERISGGATRGNNLFHSFQEFNVGEGKGAYFNNPAAIQNIFTRVTGNNISNIQGVLGVLGNANLFLMNPNGIIFGNNASLDIRGSFLATTADSILFPDGNDFSAMNPEAAPLLTVEVQQPIGLRFAGQSGTITNRGILGVDAGKRLALVGGDLTIDGGKLRALGGEVTLGGVSRNEIVKLNLDGNNLKLSFSKDLTLADIFINDGEVDVRTATNGGNIAIDAKNLNIVNSTLWAGINEGLGTVNSQAGDITIRAKSISVEDISTIFNSVRANAMGNGGNITLQADSLSLTGGAEIVANTSGQGNVGDIAIQVSGHIVFDGVDEFGFTSGIFNVVRKDGRGNGGNVTVTASSLSLTNGGEILANTLGQGNAGKVTIRISDRFLIDGIETVNQDSSGVFTTVDSEVVDGQLIQGVGRAGDILVIARSLSITNEGQLTSTTFGQGDAGNITIKVKDDFSLDGEFSGVFSAVAPDAVGNGGNIKVTAKSISISNEAILNSVTGGKGKAGTITIDSNTLKLIKSGRIEALTRSQENAGIIKINSNLITVDRESSISALTEASGDGGTITINAPQALILKDDSQLTVETSDAGKPGNINISSPNLTIGKDAEISATATETSTNTEGGGSIAIETSNLDLTGKLGIFAETQGDTPAGTLNIQPYQNQGELDIKFTDTAIISSSTTASGAGGDINLTAPETIDINGKGKVAVETRGSGDAGSINITTKDLNISNQTEISASTLGTGKAGNINITVDNLNLARSASIFTDTEGSLPGGNINLAIAEVLTLGNNSRITAEAGNEQAGGDGGNIKIDAPFIIAFPVENSDITANAFAGDGGNITINTQGIFGIEFRDKETILSDITASSEFGRQGEVEIDTSAIDPTRSLNRLPQEATKTEVAQSCQEANRESTLEFFDIGRGGLPPTPEDLFSSDEIIAEWIPLEQDIKVELRSSFTEDKITNLTLFNSFPCRE